MNDNEAIDYLVLRNDDRERISWSSTQLKCTLIERFDVCLDVFYNTVCTKCFQQKI